MNHGDSLHVVAIESAQSRARTHASNLEKAGYVVRCDHAANGKTLEDILNCSVPDIVIYGTGAKIPTLTAVSEMLSRLGHEIPVLAISDETGSIASRVRHELKSAQQDRRLGLLEAEIENIRLQQRIGELEITLKEQETRCQELIENSRDAIAYVHNGKHVYGNRSYLGMFGICSNEDLEGTPLQHMIDPADHEKLDRLLHNEGNREAITANIRLSSPVAHTVDSCVDFSTVRFENRPCTRITVRGDTMETIPEQKPDVCDQRDVFTGLHNRQYFIKTLDENISGNSLAGLLQSITYVLLDNFKVIREDIGIIAGDRMIGEIAELIEEVYGPEAIVAQFGDHVFTILNKPGDSETSLLIAETLRQRLEEYEYESEIDGHTVRTTCSIGICLINEHIADAENALLRADLACELARSSGGNQVHLHSTAIDDQINCNIDQHWEEMIRNTINKNRFYLVYQPIVSLDADKTARYEVLLRVTDAAGHVMLPGQFISIAEETGMIGEIDRRIISTAMETIPGRQDGEISLFIKISRHTLADRDFPDWLRHVLEQHRLKASRITFQITESAAADNKSETLAFIQAMHDIHCKVAIEHIGRMLQPAEFMKLPVDYLKIDGSLVNKLLGCKNARSAVNNIMEFAHKANIPCIAERVDEAACLVMLWKYNIDYIQGNFVQEPCKQLDYRFGDEIASRDLEETV